MLVISRRKLEVLEIGDSIRVYVRSINGSKVVLAVDAPADVRIRRSEYLEPRDVSVSEPREDAARRRTIREFLGNAIRSYISRHPVSPEGEYRPHERICGRCREIRIRCRCKEN